MLEEQRVDADLKLSELQIATNTRLRELLTIAEHARTEAEKANRTKDEFLAMRSRASARRRATADGLPESGFQACRGRRHAHTLDVLLVEDDADSRAALEIVLRSHGSRVRSAASVREALLAYDAQPPDVVIGDVGMPGESGYVLIRALRDREEGRGHRTRAIAMTGFAGREDHETALRAGFDEHVARPVEPEDLLDRGRCLRPRGWVAGGTVDLGPTAATNCASVPRTEARRRAIAMGRLLHKNARHG